MSQDFSNLMDNNDEEYDPLEDERLEHLPESVRARAPTDEDAIAWEEDFRVTRDKDGDIIPVWEPIPGTTKQVCVRAMTQGEIEEWLPQSGDIVSNLDDAQIIAILKEFYEVPDFGAAGIETTSDMEDFLGFGLDPLLGALLNASGMDMARGMFAENSQLISMVTGNTNGTS